MCTLVLRRSRTSLSKLCNLIKDKHKKLSTPQCVGNAWNTSRNKGSLHFNRSDCALRNQVATTPWSLPHTYHVFVYFVILFGQVCLYNFPLSSLSYNLNFLYSIYSTSKPTCPRRRSSSLYLHRLIHLLHRHSIFTKVCHKCQQIRHVEKVKGSFELMTFRAEMFKAVYHCQSCSGNDGTKYNGHKWDFYFQCFNFSWLVGVGRRCWHWHVGVICELRDDPLPLLRVCWRNTLKSMLLLLLKRSTYRV